jgi:pimeloyl-ACP methyl ester carboxylesterase
MIDRTRPRERDDPFTRAEGAAHPLPPVERVDIAGISVAYRRAGTGPPIVLLHGAYQDSRFWSRQLAGLYDEFSLLAWDAPAFGLSDDPPASFTTDDYGDCLAGFISALSLHRPVVLGLSFGSVLALTLYWRHPDTVGSLVLASAYAGWAGSLPPEEVQRRLRQGTRELELPPEQILPAWIPTLLTPTAPQQLVDEVWAMMRDFHATGMRVACTRWAPPTCARCSLRSPSPPSCCTATPTCVPRSASDASYTPTSPGPRSRSFQVHHTWPASNSPTSSTTRSVASPDKLSPGERPSHPWP